MFLKASFPIAALYAWSAQTADDGYIVPGLIVASCSLGADVMGSHQSCNSNAADIDCGACEEAVKNATGEKHIYHEVWPVGNNKLLFLAQAIAPCHIMMTSHPIFPKN